MEGIDHIVNGYVRTLVSLSISLVLFGIVSAPSLTLFYLAALICAAGM
jgi:hypothetical protein